MVGGDWSQSAGAREPRTTRHACARGSARVTALSLDDMKLVLRVTLLFIAV